MYFASALLMAAECAVIMSGLIPMVYCMHSKRVGLFCSVLKQAVLYIVPPFHLDCAMFWVHQLLWVHHACFLGLS